MFKFILTLMFQGMFPCILGLGGGQFLGQAQQAQSQANQAAGQFGANATQENATLNPFFSQEMKAQHSLTPGQENEMLTAADAGAGGAFGGAQGELERNAARTGNASTVSKSLDEMARDRAKSSAGASEGIAAQDVSGVKALNQAGAQGMQGLYGTNVNAQLGAMKQNAEDINLENQVKGPNWASQLTQLASLGGAVAGDVTGVGNAIQGPGKTSWLS
jgi:hypothetical protein